MKTYQFFLLSMILILHIIVSIGQLEVLTALRVEVEYANLSEDLRITTCVLPDPLDKIVCVSSSGDDVLELPPMTIRGQTDKDIEA